MPRPINSRLFTSFYINDGKVERNVIRSCTVREAWEEHNEMGPNAFDDRRLVNGDVSYEIALTLPSLVSEFGED